MNKLLRIITECESEKASSSKAQSEKKRAYTRVFINSLTHEMFIGILPEEHDKKQPVVINIEMTETHKTSTGSRSGDEFVDYRKVKEIIEEISGKGHIELLETFAELIARECLDSLNIEDIKVRLEKKGILKNSEGAGVEILRTRSA